MSDAPRKPARPSHPTSMPPEIPVELDSSWDDDTSPRFELDDPMSESAFDRVTAIPELPSEVFAKQVMSEQGEEPAAPSQATAAQPDAREPVPRLASEPPVVSVRPFDLDSLELQPPPPKGRVVDEHRAPPDRSTTDTARPGRQHRGVGVAPTGLELMEVSPPPPQTSPSKAASPQGRDPRDPVLELDLEEVARSGPPPAVLVTSAPSSGRAVEIGEMKDRYAMGDFTGALAVAETLLEANADDIDAQRYAQSCRDVLTQMYTARLGALSQRVRVAVPGDQIRWLSLDHRAGFVLSLIDGSSTVEELLDISGMNRLDALRILYTLFDQRVISLS